MAGENAQSTVRRDAGSPKRKPPSTKNDGKIQFLWVNKNASSLSLSNSKYDCSSAAAINRHAQRLSRAAAGGQKKSLVLAKKNSSSSSPVVEASPTRSPRINSVNSPASSTSSPSQFILPYDPVRADVAPRTPIEAPIPTISKFNVKTIVRAPLSGRERPNACTCNRQHYLCLQHRQRVSPSPQFRSLSSYGEVEFDVWAHRIVQYFTSYLIPSIISSDVEPSFLVGCDQESFIHNIVRGCLSNKMHMDSLLAFTSDRMKYVTQDQLARNDTPEIYAVKAIRAVRASLQSSQKIDHQIILDIFFLAWIDVHHMNHEGGRRHLLVVRDLVAILGGLDKLDSLVSRLIHIADLHIAAKTGNVPIFDLAWDPGPFSGIPQGMMKLTAVSPVNTGNLLLRWTELRNPLRSVIHDVVDCVRIAQNSWLNPGGSQIDMPWIVQRANALLYRLLVIPMPSVGEPNTRTLKQECCRLALIAWTLYISFGLAGDCTLAKSAFLARAFVPSNGKRLRETLLRIGNSAGKDCWGSDRTVYLWMICIGVCSTRGEDHKYFLERFRSATSQLGIETYGELSFTMEGYLPFDKKGTTSLRKLATFLGGPE
jgi:hypothetical protein